MLGVAFSFRQLLFGNRLALRRSKHRNPLCYHPGQTVATDGKAGLFKIEHPTKTPRLSALGLSDLPEFNDHAFRVLALRAFEGSEIESRLIRFNLRKIHLRRAFWAPRAIIYVRVLRRIFERWHVQAAYSFPTASVST
jgi:hypothetical protein